MNKALLNAPGDAVTEMLEGLVASVEHLNRLDGFPEVKVIFDESSNNNRNERVSVISGGGAGHEPAHAGFVGPGMLSAAVCGDVFASPSSAAVLAAIRQVTGPAGALLIVKNYTGDRLHFGIAAEQAKVEGFKVELVVVADDCALEGKGLAGRRGVAGTVFVHKVAGAAAAAGLPLEDVKAEAEEAAAAVGSMGVATSACTLPGATPSDRIKPGEMELGLGIHGEPGAETTQQLPVSEVVAALLNRIAGRDSSRGRHLPSLQLAEGAPVALLVNSLGATTAMELLVAARSALRHTRDSLQVDVQRVYVGHYMTALDMGGLSLSLLALNEGFLKRLDAPTQAPGWPRGSAVARLDKLPAPLPSAPASAAGAAKTGSSRPKELSQQAALLERCIAAAADALIERAGHLDELDGRVGDGDCGATLALAARAIKQNLAERYPLDDPAATLAAIGDSVGRAAGGTSGGLYHVMLAAAAASLAGNQRNLASWAEAARAAVNAAQHYGGARAGSRTMLDALLPAVDNLEKATGDAAGAATAAASAAEQGADSTMRMDAGAGRSSYVPARVLADTPDPGAVAVGIWLKAVAHTLTAA